MATFTAVSTILTALACASPALGQSTTDSAEEARAVVDRALAAYRSMDEYDHRCELVRVFDVVEGSRTTRPMDRATVNRFSSSGDRFLLTTGNWMVLSDGETIWLRRPDIGQYMTRTIAEGDSLVAWLEEQTDDRIELSLPERALIDRDGDIEQVFGADFELIGVRAVNPPSGPAKSVAAKIGDQWFGGDAVVRIDMAFDDATGLLVETQADITGAYANVAQRRARSRGRAESSEYAAKGVSGTATSSVKLLESEELEFGAEDKPAEWELLVDRFDARRRPEVPRQEQKNLVGQKAPLFSAKTAEGETILLDELQGNVVLLDFWATWCPHCVRTCPDIQGIADAFADKPVVVLGINRDRPGTEERVEQFVSRNGLTFDQIYDFDRMIARRFDVGTIPSTVIIDADGIIRVFHSGVPDDQVRVLTDSITELLAEIESP